MVVPFLDALHRVISLMVGPVELRFSVYSGATKTLQFFAVFELS